MVKIVQLKDFRTKTLEQRAFGPWKKRFGENFSHETRLSDISDKTLLYLSQPGETSTVAFYELIMGVLNFGHASKFSYLENDDQLYVMEIHLFLSDLCRFEMMGRLGWIRFKDCSVKSLIELIGNFLKYKDFCRRNPPELSESHPDYNSYKNLHERDREGFIRRLLPGALDIFQRKVNQ